ncbi:MAG TPA: hypothetical protein PL048_05685 [Leptospiraceae bacterium]|nr:hypothetical protein [Leptospiraceae bacterium]HMY67179.1 hypothetical protein [Leptospiraceae bacterium]HMZ58243.1 hypothetical protein [Leptospiraceae bacterium]HNF13921.1 hypothetical protein [Leptospiraceae bacterium]HNF26002.1 hypothetical protein [Leptospiraceae bacterium]
MKKKFMIILLLLFSAGFIYAQDTAPEEPASTKGTSKKKIESKKEMSLGEMVKILKGTTFDFGNGVTFKATDPMKKKGDYMRKGSSMGYTFGSFSKTGPNSAGYFCPSLGNVEFTIHPDTITYKLNSVSLKNIKSHFKTAVPASQTVKRQK